MRGQYCHSMVFGIDIEGGIVVGIVSTDSPMVVKHEDVLTLVIISTAR